MHTEYDEFSHLKGLNSHFMFNDIYKISLNAPKERQHAKQSSSLINGCI